MNQPLKRLCAAMLGIGLLGSALPVTAQESADAPPAEAPAKETAEAAAPDPAASPAAEAPASPHTVTANVGFASEYVFRGISQTDGDPAIQGGFDYAHESGVYLGTWASNISGTFYPGASLEWDFYGGYNGKITDDLSYNVGLLYYYYPTNETAAEVLDDSGAVVNTGDFDTLEFYAGATYKFLNVKYSHSLSDDLFGVPDARGSGYFEANLNFTLPAEIGLALHYGVTDVDDHSDLDYDDWKIGVSKAIGGFTAGAAYTNTDIRPDLVSGGEELSDGRLVLTVSRAF